MTIPIYDIITDARPDSKTFGLTNAYLLDPVKQNKLYVPHGFLHAFAVPNANADVNAMFMYYCDNVYSHESEICINPLSLVPDAIKQMNINKDDELYSLAQMLENLNNIVLSEKDINGQDYCEFMQKQKEAYNATGKLWYV